MIRWVAFFLAVLSVVVVTLAAATHDDADGPSCLLCKLGHEPVVLATTADAPQAPLAVDAVQGEVELAERTVPDHGLQPRAPPI